jgi:Zn-dependent protease with chaperone function
VRLYTLHKIFIAVVMIFSLIMMAYGFHGYSAKANTGALASGIAGLCFGVLGLFYGRWFSRKFKS